MKAEVYTYRNALDGSFHIFSAKGANFSASYRRFDIIARDIQSFDKINIKRVFR